jgi:hypothetical protein
MLSVLRTSGIAVRRAAAAVALVTVVGVFAACGREPAEGGGEGTASGSPSASETAEPSASSGSHEPGSSADGECSGVETQEVKVADGVQVEVPADWSTPSRGGSVRLFPPDRDKGDGFIVVEQKDQTLDEAMQDVEEFNSVARPTSEQELDLAGFEAAKMTTYEYEDGTFTVHVVAVGDGVRVNANMTREPATEQAVVESCLSTLTRSS